jgi:hypothetical protein
MAFSLIANQYVKVNHVKLSPVKEAGTTEPAIEESDNAMSHTWYNLAQLSKALMREEHGFE